MLNHTRLWNPPRLLLICLVLFGLAVGCEDETKQTAGSASASAAKPPAPATVSKPLADLEAPPEVVAYGGTDNFQKLIIDVQKLVADFAPGSVPPPATLVQELTKALKLKNADGVDFAKPARFVLVDPKKHESPFALVIGTKGKDKMLASLPDDKKENDSGNAYSWTTQSGKTAHLNFIEDFAVLSPSKDIYPAHKAFIGQVLKAKLPAPVAVVGSMINIMKLYGADLDQGIKDAKETMKKGAPPGVAKPGTPSPKAQAAQLEGVAAMFDWFAATIKEMDKAILALAMAADGARLSFQMRPKKGTELEQTFKLLGKRPFDLLAKLPADAPFFFAMNIDPDKAGALTKKLVQWSLTFGMSGKEVPDKYVQGMSDYWQATTGEFVVAAHKALEGEGLSLTGMMGLRDADKARASMKLIAEMYKEPGVLDSYKQMGMTIEFKEQAYKIGDVPVATQRVKMKKPMEELGPLGPVLQDLMFTHTAMAEDLGYIAYGKEGKATLEAFMGGKVTGGLHQAPGVKRALSKAAPGTFFVMYAVPVDLAKGLHLGGKNPLADKLAAQPPSKTGLCISAGATGGVVDVVFDVPTDQARAIAQLVAMAQLLRGGLLPTSPGGPARPGGLPPSILAPPGGKPAKPSLPAKPIVK